MVSVLSKFKPGYHFLEIKPEWIEFSFESAEFDLLEKIAKEKSGTVGINLLKRHGVHPSEQDAIKDTFEAYIESGKQLSRLIKKVAGETGLSNSEIELRYSAAIAEEIRELEAQKDNPDWNAGDAATLTNLRAIAKDEATAIAERLKGYVGELDRLQGEYNVNYDAYLVGIVSVFLSRRAEVKIDFTPENVRNLHSGFIAALLSFLVKEINNAWDSEDVTSGKQNS